MYELKLKCDTEAATRGVLWKKLFSACNFIKKETLAQVIPCEFCEISKNTFSYRTPPVAASAYPHLWFQRYELEESFNFVKQPFYGNSSLTHCHVVIYRVRCKILSGKWVEDEWIKVMLGRRKCRSNPRVPP